MDDEPDRFGKLLQAHLNVNPKSWAALQLRGVDEQTSLRLDFEFTAPDEEHTRALMKALRTATDYEFQGGARNQDDGSQRWLVLGTTPPATWSLDRLNAFVTEMTGYGRPHEATFDGWGATAHESAEQAAARKGSFRDRLKAGLQAKRSRRQARR